MEKVKITVEQEKAFKTFMEQSGKEIFSELIEVLIDKSCEFQSIALKPLNDIPDEHFLYILCGWYEVEQPFKVESGEWYYFNDGDSYHKVVALECAEGAKDRYRFKDGQFDYLERLKSRYEKVTDEWKITLLNLGREEPELKVGDAYTTTGGAHYIVHALGETVKNHHSKHFESGIVKRFYPVERSIEFK